MKETCNIFTMKIPGQIADIRSYVVVANPSNLSVAFGTMAVWDTGSPICFISKKLMTLLGLKFESECPGHGIFSPGTVYYGKVSVRLVSDGRFIDIQAAVVDNLHRGSQCQALLGMNLIAKGQMSLAYKDNVTTFSFAIPALDAHDLVDVAVSSDVPAKFDYIDASDIGEADVKA